MQKEYLYPEIGDRNSPKEWYEKDRPELLREAKKRVDHILSNHFPAHISDEADSALRQQFDIKLPREVMLKS